MEFHKLFAFLEILRESFKIMSRKCRLMAFIATLYLLLYSLFFFFFVHSTKSLVQKENHLSSANPHRHILLVAISHDFLKLLKVDFVFPIAFFFLSLFVQTATVLVSANSYSEGNFSFKDLVYRSWTRAFVTSFHVSLYFIGFIFFAFAMIMVPPSMIYNRAFSYALLYLLYFFAIVFYLDFSVIWVLALVISVIEESSGVEALGKAGGLVKGNKLDGFILSFLFTLLSLALIYGVNGIIFERSPNAVQMILGVFLICAYCLVNMFQFTVFTVFYSVCKKNHGEEIELRADMDYNKIPRLPVVNEAQPASIYKNLFKYYAFQII